MRVAKRRLMTLAMCAMLLTASTASASVFLLDFSGFDYTVNGDLGDPGSCYYALGFVPAVNSTFLNFDYANNEYTFNIQYTCQVSAFTFGNTAIYEYGPQGALAPAFDIYCDAIAGGTAADYGNNPPNPTAPLTFSDGTNVLGGDFTGNLIFTLDLSTGNGNMQGELDWVRGSQLSGIPLESRTMSLTLAGITFDTPGIHDGYLWQIDGQASIDDPVATTASSWGYVKSFFGEDN